MSIYQEIEREREGQIALGFTPNHDDGHTVADWVALLARTIGLAVDDGDPNATGRFRRQMVRAAALALAALEAWDRRYAPEAPRLGGEKVHSIMNARPVRGPVPESPEGRVLQLALDLARSHGRPFLVVRPYKTPQADTACSWHACRQDQADPYEKANALLLVMPDGTCRTPVGAAAEEGT